MVCLFEDCSPDQKAPISAAQCSVLLLVLMCAAAAAAALQCPSGSWVNAFALRVEPRLVSQSTASAVLHMHMLCGRCAGHMKVDWQHSAIYYKWHARACYTLSICCWPICTVSIWTHPCRQQAPALDASPHREQTLLCTPILENTVLDKSHYMLPATVLIITPHAAVICCCRVPSGTIQR
jgi:hypothetical protein